MMKKVMEHIKKHIMIYGWIVIILFIIGLIVTTIILSQKKEVKQVDMETLASYQNSYIGDVSKVRGILEELPYAEYLENIELTTSKKPYGLKANYTIDKTKTELEFSTLVLYTLITNVDTITYHMPESDYIVTRQEAKAIQPQLTIEAIQNNLNQKYYPSEDSAYQITINQFGKPVFANSKKALEQAKKDLRSWNKTNTK